MLRVDLCFEPKQQRVREGCPMPGACLTLEPVKSEMRVTQTDAGDDVRQENAAKMMND